MDFFDDDDWTNIFETISPLIDSHAQRRQAVKTFLPDMLDMGYTGQAALNLFRESGLGIRSSEFYDIRREIMSDVNLTSALRNLGLDEMISESMMRIASRELTAKYRYVAAYAIENTSTGDAIFGEYAIDRDEVMTKSDALNQIINTLTAKYPLGNFETLTVNLRRAYVMLG